MIAGQTLNIDGKDVRCPSAPLYFIKSMGQVIDIHTHHYDAIQSYERTTGDRELWRLDGKGLYNLLRRKFGNKEYET